VALVPLLDSGNDDLVREVLRVLAKRRAYHTLPALLLLYECYPDDRQWRHGAIDPMESHDVDVRWLTKFGDPDRMRVRPEVVEELRRTIIAITGVECATPAELRRLLRRSDVKERMRRTKGG
jgi:hypothetical protein